MSTPKGVGVDISEYANRMDYGIKEREGLSFLQLLTDFVVGGTGAKAGVGDDFADGDFRVLDLKTRGVREAAVIDIGEETAQA